MKKVKLVVVAYFFILLNAHAQKGSFDIQFVYDNSSCQTKKMTVKIQIKAHQDTTQFYLGDATIRFDYNKTELINPVIKTQYNFSSTALTPDFNYGGMSFNKIESGNTGIGSISISYLGLLNSAKLIGTDWSDVALLEFDIVTTSNCTTLTLHDNTKTPITGMSEVVNPGATYTTSIIKGNQFISLNKCNLFSLPVASIIANPNNILSGASSTLTVTLDAGNKPWSFQLSDGTGVQNSANNKESLSVKPLSSTKYSIVSVTDACGTTNYLATQAPFAMVDVAIEALPPVVTLCTSKCSYISAQKIR